MQPKHPLPFRFWLGTLCALLWFWTAPAAERLRVLVETDAGGDPDDEQSLVRFLLYANEWDVEGIIANREQVRPGENLNSERTGLGIVQRLVRAYGACHEHLVQHDSRYPTATTLLERTVPGYGNVDDGVQLILRVVDAPDPRPVWFMNWGTDAGSAPSCLQRALDRVRRDRGPEGYARFKTKLRLSSDDQFGDHTFTLQPPFALWVDTFRPPVDGKRWYHQFSAITARAGGFDLVRDALTGHGPLGALYPANTTHRQKEGDTMTFLYLVPTGMNDPERPGWGSWAGRYGPRDGAGTRPYYWANQADAWRGTTHRDDTVSRWAADLQNDFRARLDWCVKPFPAANHKPIAVLNGDTNTTILVIEVAAGSSVRLSAAGSTDPDLDPWKVRWEIYPEAGTFSPAAPIEAAAAVETRVSVPPEAAGKEIHVILAVSDLGDPPLTAYRRAILRAR